MKLVEMIGPVYQINKAIYRQLSPKPQYIQCSSNGGTIILYCRHTSRMYKAHQIPKRKWFLYHVAIVFAQSIEARCQVENEELVGAMLLPTKVRLMS